MESPANRSADFKSELHPALRKRRSVRQKVHIPAYANLNRSPSGMVLELNEIIDISEEGICIQTSSPLKPHHTLPIALDLAETKAFIETTGQVVWTDKAGRAGMHFPEMPAQSKQQLREWLFANAIAACVRHAEVKAPRSLASKSGVPKRPAASFVPAPPENLSGESLTEAALRQLASAQIEPSAPAAYAAMVSGLAAAQKELEGMAGDAQPALQVIAGCALTFTGASGAAVALEDRLLNHDGEAGASPGEMTCCAVAGCDAPPLHSRLQAGSGFSGECVRSRRLLSCEDSETDPRVDRETCRALGIRSMVAVPVLLEDDAVGILEIFSPQAGAFVARDHMVLERLAGMIPGVLSRSRRTVPEVPAPAISPPPFPDGLRFGDLAPARPSNYKYYKALLIAAVITLLMVLLWLLLPRTRGKAGSRVSPPVVREDAAASRAPAFSLNDLEAIRRLASQGDMAAQYALGVRYATGDEVKEDYAEAVTWFMRAAEQGSVPAQATLGAYYWAGRGVPQDLKKAYFWAVLAQAGGDQGSKYRTAVLASRLNRSQIVSAQQQADDWIKARRPAARR